MNPKRRLLIVTSKSGTTLGIRLSVRGFLIAGCSMIIGTPPCAFAGTNQALLNSSLRMMWGLLVVVGILLIIYYIARKRLSVIQGSSKRVIRVIETRHLMPKKSLYLVEVRGKEFLLGAGSDSIELIATITDTPDSRPFAELLHNSEHNEQS